MDAVRLDKLTDRERAYLRLVRNGMSSKEIALQFGVQPGTVDSGLKSAMAKLGTSSRRSAARMAADWEAQKLACQSQPLESLIGSGRMDPSELDRDWSAAPAPEHRVREAQVPYEAWLQTAPGFRLPFPRYQGDFNELTQKERLLWIGAISLGIALIASALVAVSWGAVRVIGQILSAFS
jgi:DNA-binding CsgD family transcriptional regulator